MFNNTLVNFNALTHQDEDDEDVGAESELDESESEPEVGTEEEKNEAKPYDLTQKDQKTRSAEEVGSHIQNTQA